MNNFKQLLLEEKNLIDKIIRMKFEKNKPLFYMPLYEAMEYSLFSGGKRIRPILLKWCAETSNSKMSTPEILKKAITAVEYIHTYSLIHDDLPAMDDDNIRRGKPSSHKKFTEAIAILAGDALLTEAFGLLGSTGRGELVVTLATASGAGGMVSGQAADIEGKKDSNYINNLKTAKLFQAAAVMGGICRDDGSWLDKFADYGINLGMAFQLRDDIIDDETENIRKTGEKAANYIKSAIEALKGLDNTDRLIKLAKFVIEREK